MRDSMSQEASHSLPSSIRETSETPSGKDEIIINMKALGIQNEEEEPQQPIEVRHPRPYAARSTTHSSTPATTLPLQHPEPTNS
ncbi:hypothetical protein LTS18_013276, partial [Coniosporium uncinatum]